MKKLTKLGIVLAVITIAEISVFEHYDSLLNAKPTAVSVATPPQSEIDVDVTGLKPISANSLLTVSDDHSKFAYIDSSSVLRVQDTQTHKEVYSLQLLIKPVYLRWVNSTMLFVGTEVDHGSTKDLRLSTIDISTGTDPRLIQTFSGVSSDSSFKQVAFSSYTNDIYVLIGNQYSTAMYHFDANNALNTVYLGGRYVSNVGVTSTTGALYFQDFAEGTKNVLIYANQNVTLIQRNAVLLRVSGNALYYGLLDAQGLVTSVQKYENNASTPVVTLDTPTDPSKVLLTQYNDVVEISDNSYANLTNKKTTSLPDGAQTVVKDNCLYIIRPSKVSIVM